MKKFTHRRLAALLIILIAVGISYLILRETPEKCVQQKFLKWRELNKEEFSEKLPSSGIVLPPYSQDNPKEVTVRVKVIARLSFSDSSSNKALFIQSSRIILETCGVDY